MTSDLSLTPIAIEYLRHYDDLEAARGLLRGERNRILNQLGASLAAAAKEHHQNVIATKLKEDIGWLDVEVARDYVALRAKEGEKRSSGYSLAIGSFFGEVGAQAHFWFHLRLTTARISTLDIKGLESALGAKVIGEGNWLYVRLVCQPVSVLDLPAFEMTTRDLPAQFATADTWLASRYALSD